MNLEIFGPSFLNVFGCVIWAKSFKVNDNCLLQLKVTGNTLGSCTKYND